jgi:hypothetical protein
VVKRVALVILGALAITLMCSTVALAWTPSDIYDDYVAHGKLTHDYTTAELNAYANDSSLAQYGSTDVKKQLDALVKDLLDRGEYPYTGTQIAIAAVVVVVLLVGGILLWYYSHPRKRKSQGPQDSGPGDPS